MSEITTLIVTKDNTHKFFKLSNKGSVKNLIITDEFDASEFP